MTGSTRTRWAGEAEIPAIATPMALAIDQLQAEFLSPEQDGIAVGCGGWSFRATLYGGDHTASQRAPARLDPAREPARIRAMYTHPQFVRHGIGRLVLSCCEQAAGFDSVELMATLSGVPLHNAAGYAPLERTNNTAAGVALPLGEPLRPTADKRPGDVTSR